MSDSTMMLMGIGGVFVLGVLGYLQARYPKSLIQWRHELKWGGKRGAPLMKPPSSFEIGWVRFIGIMVLVGSCVAFTTVVVQLIQSIRPE